MDMPQAPSAIWPVAATLAECPVWIAGASVLAWVDIVAQTYNHLDPATGERHAWAVYGKIGSAAPVDAGLALVALESGLWLLHADGTRTPFPSPPMDGVHFNDGKCDPMGRFWVGTRASDGSNRGGALFRCTLDGAVAVADAPFDVPNGMGWSPDGRWFYLIDTVPRRLYRYAFVMETGTLGERVVLSDFAGIPGKPDGLAVDSTGRLWVAMWDGGGVCILSPTGEPAGWLATPCARPTSCAFASGGPSEESDAACGTLFVTTAALGLDPEELGFGAAGSILAYAVPAVGASVALLGQNISI